MQNLEFSPTVKVQQGSLKGEYVRIVKITATEVIVKLANGEHRIFHPDELKIQDYIEAHDE